MKFLESFEDLEGKTVKSANQSYDANAVIFFTDDTCLVVQGQQEYGSSELGVMSEDSLMDYEKRDLGIITEAEYDAIHKAEAVIRCEKNEAMERAQYARLQAKFGDSK